MMNFRSTFSIFLFSIGHVFLQAQKTPLEKHFTNRLPVNKFFDSINTSVSDQIIHTKDNYTELNAQYYSSKMENSIRQKGYGIENFSFNVTSNFLIDSSNYVWGNVFYKNGTRKNVKWNENSDYDKIYPYIIGDSIGGNLSTEEYAINGGYNRRLSDRLNFGISAKYRALLEFRNRDPRPKNITSDLDVNLGISSKIFNHKLLAFNALLHKYTQSGDLKFFNQLGNPEVVHFSGLGIYNNLFKSNTRRSYYDGNGNGFSLAYLDTERKGLMATIGFRKLSIDKILPDLQSIVPASIDEQQYTFNVSYSTPTSPLFKGIRITSKWRNRKGTEGIFFNETSSNYLKIGEATRYRHQVQTTKISSLFELLKREKIQSLSISPYMIYSSSKERYTDPLIKQNIDRLITGIETDLFYQISLKSSINFGFDAGKNSSLKQEWLSHHTYSKPSIQELMEQNYHYLTSDNWFFNLFFRQNYSINERYSIFLDAKYYHVQYKKEKNSVLQFSLGFFF